MSGGALRYEDAVLSGTALVLLDLPASLRGHVMPLRRLLDHYRPGNGVTHILLNRQPVRSTSDPNLLEYGAMFFKSANYTWDVLDRIEVQLRTEDGPLELRRGYLNLGEERILVEGVVTWGENGRRRPTPQAQSSPSAPTPAFIAPPARVEQPPTPAPATAAATSAAAAAAPVVVPRPSPVVPRADAVPSPTVSAPAHPANSAEPRAEPQTVVLSVHLKEVYNRHRNMREEHRRTGRHDLPSLFPLSPFMVYQMLMGECEPRKIVLIDSRRLSGQRLVKALVEVENAEVAERVIHVFTHRAVEFVSESDVPRRPDRARRVPEKAEPRPICAEVRYYVNSYYSTPNGHSRFHANGERNYHRSIVARNEEKDEMSILTAADKAALAVRAPREWQKDAHANRLASIPDADLMGREEPEMAEPRGGPARPAKREERPRRLSPRGGRGGRRSRSDSHSRSPSRSRSRSPSSRSSSSSSSSRGRHYRPRPRREDIRRDVGPSRKEPHVRSSSSRTEERQQPTTSKSTADSAARTAAAMLAPSAVVRETPQLVVPQQQQQQHEQQPSQPQQQQQQQQYQLYVQPEAQVLQRTPLSSSVPPPPPPRMENNGLPPNWRPIFSVEYQQTYYAYRDPQTGAEMTTWERPVS